MKNLLLIFSVLLSTSLSAVEYGYITACDTNNLQSLDEQDDKIVLESSDVLEVLSLSSRSSYAKLYAKNEDFKDIFSANFDEIFQYHISLPTIVGPCTVWIHNTHNGTSGAISYKLTRASEVEYKQVNIVSLPLDDVGNGTHNIVVEASDDLQSWTPVHSSSIGGNKAFFRTRVVEAE
jgi:hypothetical protein